MLTHVALCSQVQDITSKTSQIALMGPEAAVVLKELSPVGGDPNSQPTSFTLLLLALYPNTSSSAVNPLINGKHLQAGQG